MDERRSQERFSISEPLRQATSALVAVLANEIISVLYYPHPCRSGGIVIVFREDVRCYADLISAAYQFVPSGILLHCFRSDDFFELALPLTGGIDALTSHLHLAFCLRHRGVVLYGEDLRSEIRLPERPGVLLSIHLEACAHSFRNTVILGLLARKEYLDLISKLEWQVRCLMVTALLFRDEREVDANTLSEKFEQWYPDEKMHAIWTELSGLLQNSNAGNHASDRQAAFQAAWLFESFLRQLRTYAS
jgi:hypothetical protein